MSKFFRALEHAERERAERRTAPDDGRVSREARAAVVEAPPDHVIATPAPPPPVVDEAPPTVERPVYGAPVVRPAAAHESAFAALLEPPPVLEPGAVDDHLVSVLEPTSPAAEQYRAVRLAIDSFRRERGTRVVAVASPGRGDGRTVTAINVAGALAQASDARVALVEADLRHPTMGRALGLRGGIGLGAYLLDPAISVDSTIQRPAGLAFAVVLAGATSSMPYELLSSPRLGTLLGTLRESFDVVVVDTPPASPFPDVGILREVVDGFVVVVRANRTPREQVHQTLAALGAQHVLGVVFNDAAMLGVAPRARRRSAFRRLLGRSRGAVRAA
jgi:capsular exopolysaccharide synthesis family protein